MPCRDCAPLQLASNAAPGQLVLSDELGTPLPPPTGRDGRQLLVGPRICPGWRGRPATTWSAEKVSRLVGCPVQALSRIEDFPRQPGQGSGTPTR